jgi:D-alanyl-D-alanine carboxypeptidase
MQSALSISTFRKRNSSISADASRRHGGEMPGYNSFMGYDPVNDVTLVIWTNLTLSLDGKPTANSIMLRMLDQIYTVSPLQ